VQKWAKSLKDHPEQSHLMVTYTNRDTHLLNEEARHLMRKQGVMGVEEHFHITKRESRDDFGKPVVHEERKAFSKGERLVFTRNDRHLKVRNGTLGTIEEMDGQNLKVRIDGDHRVISFASKLYPYFDRGWAITIIKSQGSTADRVFKLATFEEDRNLAYVAMTRHRESLCVFGSKLDFWREEIFGDRLSQNREKMSSLDYLSQEEAQRRLNPPARLMDALSFLGNKLEGLGYASRKSWESLCDHFLGKTPPENPIIFAQNSIEEAVRAMDMGINAAPPASELLSLSDRQQSIFSELKKSIMGNTQFSEERKQKWIQFGLQDPEGTLQSWNGILIQQQIQEERRQERSQALEHALEEIRNPKAVIDDAAAMREENSALVTDHEQTMPDQQPDIQQELMNQAHSLMEKVREILPEEDFKKFEASLTEKPEAILDRCCDVIASHEEVLRLEADVSKFIELLDRSRDIIALTSGESKQIEPVLKEIFHQWKDDERFMEKLKESNNIKACQRVEYYQREENRIRSQSYGYALEM
jgi:signal transduction histidine kinase